MSGWKTASAATEWEIDAGTLVVLPTANVQAVERESRTYPEGRDLNRQFERGKPPKTQLAHDIWYTIVRHDPDVLVDLHSSMGFQADDDGYVGQNIFHSQRGTMGPDAEEATAYLNENYVPESRKPRYAFVTTTMSKNLAMIADKARADLGIPTAIFEVTEADLPVETRAAWTEAYTRWIFHHWGLKELQKTGSV
ncbi:Succinylglutamate desuccinylase / Aspartoacylase family protein [Halogranum amylolyticum]|uniref:Succinylglutamate desuccinylase / Aspartoacylase family protein n=1 Tax=Halogranum amylolyticum TaxID=660520 RepID=A0A1H8SEV6_9EURY|nr:succinylglutamate desuccinylase/aspartoacylase family protein [Halogranum amylolyticum]SEO77105.1 Succinylglutamate desuccinylase / Aspartoacylase family protein [Halogranum amylolyticum]